MAGDEHDPRKQSKYYDHYAKVLGGPDGPPSRRSHTRRNSLIGAGAAVVVAAGVVGIVLTTQGDSPGDAQAATTAATGGAAHPTATTPRPTEWTAATPSTLSPLAHSSVQPGWKIVKGLATDHATFQIPKGWINQFQTESVVMWGIQPDLGYSSPNMVGLHSASFAGVGTCKTNDKQQTAAAGFRPPSDDLPSAAAQSEATRLAKAIALTDKGKPGKKPGTPKTSSVQINGMDATMAKVTVVDGSPGGKDCHPKKSDVFTVAFNAGSKTTVWALVRDHHGTKVPSDAAVKKMIGTITVLK